MRESGSTSIPMGRRRSLTSVFGAVDPEQGVSVTIETNHEQDIDALVAEWCPEDGFFSRVRQGHFSPHHFERALKKVSAIHMEREVAVPRRLVSLLWYIPLFMHWQVERVRENGGDVEAYQRATVAMTNEVERLLGVP